MRHRSEKTKWNTVEHQKCLCMSLHMHSQIPEALKHDLHMSLHIHSLIPEALRGNLDLRGVFLLPTPHPPNP